MPIPLGGGTAGQGRPNEARPAHTLDNAPYPLAPYVDTCARGEKLVCTSKDRKNKQMGDYPLILNNLTPSHVNLSVNRMYLFP